MTVREPGFFGRQAAECATACARLPLRENRQASRLSNWAPLFKVRPQPLIVRAGDGAAPQQSQRQASTVRAQLPPLQLEGRTGSSLEGRLEGGLVPIVVYLII